MKNGNNIKDVILQYRSMGLNVEKISEKTGLEASSIRRALKGIEKPLETNTEPKVKEIEERAKKRLDNLDKLSSGELVKSEYSNSWLDPASEMVKINVGKHIALEYATNITYVNLFEEIKELLNWEKEKIKEIRENIDSGIESSYKLMEQLKLVKKVVKEQLRSMGVKSTKEITEMIEKIGTLNIGEEKLILEKTKFVKEDENVQKSRNLLEKLVNGTDELTDEVLEMVDREEN